MKRCFPLLVALLCACPLLAQLSEQEFAIPSKQELRREPDEALLRRLDRMIEQREVYQHRVEQKIASLHRQLEYAEDPMSRFRILDDLFTCYRSFRIDTAMVVVQERMRLAREMGNDSCIILSRMNLADVMNKMGHHKEALGILNRLDRTERMDRDTYFHYLYHTIYLSCYNEETDPEQKRYFREQIKAYKDTLVSISEPGSTGYITNKCGRLGMAGQWDEAIRLLQEHYEGISDSNPDKARVEYLLAELCLSKQDTLQARRWLILAAITDIANAKKVYMSLQHLAVLLYREGDVARAYRYIFCSLEDVNFGEARYRMVDIAHYLPIIKAAHDELVRAEEQRMRLSLFLLLALVVLLVTAYLFIRQRNRKLLRARQSLAEQNERLLEMAANLERMNEEIKESNHIKEEYIGLLFNICSEYIYKQETERKVLLKIANTGSIADISKALRSHTTTTEDFKQFIGKFDTIFLSLFPTFVEQFNHLLRPEERVTLREGELLTPELRIYALVRLGIGDSSKIANFLHYSLQTVYNYRMKMRNKALVPGKDLALQVRQIG